MELIKYTLLAIKKWLLQENNPNYQALLESISEETLITNKPSSLKNDDSKKEEEEIMRGCYYFSSETYYNSPTRLKCAVNPSEKCSNCQYWRSKDEI